MFALMLLSEPLSLDICTAELLAFSATSSSCKLHARFLRVTTPRPTEYLFLETFHKRFKVRGGGEFLSPSANHVFKLHEKFNRYLLFATKFFKLYNKNTCNMALATRFTTVFKSANPSPGKQVTWQL